MEERTEQSQGVPMSPETMTPEARGAWEQVHGHIDLMRKEHGIEKADRKIFEQGLERHVQKQQSASSGAHDNDGMLLILEEEGINSRENSTLIKLLEIAEQKGPVEASLAARKFKDAQLLDRLHDVLMDHYEQLVKQGYFKL